MEQDAPQPEGARREGVARQRAQRHKLTSFVGREAVLEHLSRLVDDTTPLVTLLGPPGIGKTRVAQRLVDSFGAPAAVFCDLRGVTGCEGLATKLAESLDAHVETGRDLPSLVQAVANLLHTQKRRLVVLDNFEQLVDDAVEPLLRWLCAAPQCTFVVTSRRLLRVEGEQIVDLPPLSLEPSPERPSEAMQLFVERAKAAEPAFDAGATAEIRGLVRHLQGLPLALELAAGQMRQVRPGELLKQLKKGPSISLESAVRDREPRHRSLRAAIEASWTALKPFERSALSQLTVCRQGFVHEACEAIIQLDEFSDAPPVATVVRCLRESSLIHVDPGLKASDPLRWDMYEAIREYAAGFPKAGAEERHAAHFVAQGRQWISTVGTPEELSVRGALGRESGNLGAAFEWLLTRQEENTTQLSELALVFYELCRASQPALAIAPLTHTLDRLAGATEASRAQLLMARGSCYRDVGAMEQAKADFDNARMGTPGDALLEAELDIEEAALVFSCGDIRRSRTLLGRAIETACCHRASRLEGRARTWLARILTEAFQDSSALSQFRKALRIAQTAGDLHQEALIRTLMASRHVLQQRAQNPEEVEALVTQARLLENRDVEVLAEQVLGLLYLDSEQPTKSRMHFDRALAVSRSSGLLRYEACIEFWLSALNALNALEAVHSGSDADREAIAARFRTLGDTRNEAFALVQVSADVARQGDIRRARTLLKRGAKLGTRFGDRGLVLLAEIQEARVDLAESLWFWGKGHAARANELQDRARKRVRLACARSVQDTDQADAGVPLITRSVEARWALKRFEQELTLAETAKPTLRVRTDGAAFQIADGTMVTLPESSILCHALQALAEKRITAPGDAVELHEFLGRCWPEERISRKVTSQRLRQVITRLRRAGLETLLRQADGGYFLDPDVAVQLVPEPRQFSKPSRLPD